MNIYIQDIDKMLNGFAMPQDLQRLIDGMAHRIMDISDNDILVTGLDCEYGEEARKARKEAPMHEVSVRIRTHMNAEDLSAYLKGHLGDLMRAEDDIEAWSYLKVVSI